MRLRRIKEGHRSLWPGFFCNGCKRIDKKIDKRAGLINKEMLKGEISGQWVRL